MALSVRKFAVHFLPLTVAALLAGCATTDPGAASGDEPLASIKIEFASDYDLGQAILIVFARDGYQQFERTADTFTFQHPATGRRAEVKVNNREFGTHWVSCDVERQDPGTGQWVRDTGSRSEVKAMLKDIEKLEGVI